MEQDEAPPPDPGPSRPQPPAAAAQHTSPAEPEPEFLLSLKSVRFGSLKADFRGPVKIDPRKLSVNILDTKKSTHDQASLVNFLIAFRHVTAIQYHFSRNMNVLYLIVSDYCAAKIRAALKMADDLQSAGSLIPCFNPKSQCTHHKFITLTLSDDNDGSIKFPLLEFFKRNVEPMRLKLAQAQKDRHHGQITEMYPLLAQLTPARARTMFEATTPPYERQLKKQSPGRNQKQFVAREPPESLGSDLETQPFVPIRQTSNARATLPNKQPYNNPPMLTVRAKPMQKVAQQAGQVFYITNNINMGSGAVKQVHSTPVVRSPTTVSAAAASNNGKLVIVNVVNPTPRAPRRPRDYARQSIKRPIPATIHINEDDSPETKSARTDSDGDRVLFTYPPGKKGGIPMHLKDLDCLRDEEFLNDTIIDFYLSYIVNELVAPERRDKIYVFSSFFWNRLICPTTNPPQIAVTPGTRVTQHQRKYQWVKSWTKNVDLFEKDYILVPINEAAHWYLAIICFPANAEWATKTKVLPPKHTYSKTEEPDTAPSGTQTQSLHVIKRPNTPPSFSTPAIVLLDSLTSAATKNYSTVTILREYLANEWKDKKPNERLKTFDKNTIKGVYPRVPQQDNWWDCGIYMLQYAELFLKQPPDSVFSKNMLSSWHKDFSVANKRAELKELITSIAGIPSETVKQEGCEEKEAENPGPSSNETAPEVSSEPEPQVEMRIEPKTEEEQQPSEQLNTSAPAAIQADGDQSVKTPAKSQQTDAKSELPKTV